MYEVPTIIDYGQIELHTYALPGSSPETEEITAVDSAGSGGGAGIGLLGLIGGAAALAGRGDTDQPVAVVTDEEEKQALK